ncbi:hypothetical protein [Hypericibacter sp.]|uniref:hypothetical protein n=1 Tax=Hypericibacter sp. TaxID=2705401 RepID=UPI003D6D6359
MPTFLRQATATTVRIGPFLDKADGVTEKTALAGTLTVECSKAGPFAARSSVTAIAHDQNAWYAIPLDATDTGTLGRLILKSDDAATYLPVWAEFQVVPANVFDSLVAGSDLLQADLQQWVGAAPNALQTGRVDGSVGAMAANVLNAAAIAAGAITNAKFAADAIDANALAASAVDEILDDVVEGALTMRHILRLLLAASAGKLAGAAGVNITIRDQADTKNRINATVDLNGNRTAVAVDGT